MVPEEVNNNIWLEIETDEGKQLFCTLESARRYLGLSGPGLNLVLNKQGVKRWKLGQGAIKYLKKEDVEELKHQREQLHSSNEPRISSKQLLAGAATLLERVQAGHADTEAIAKWLEMYQEAK